MTLKVFNIQGELILEKKIIGLFFHKDGALEFTDPSWGSATIAAEDYHQFYIVN